MKCWGITSLSVFWEDGDWRSLLWSDSWWNLDAILHESHRQTHTHMYMLNMRKVTMGTAWKSSRNKGRARLQGKSLKKNRACPLSNHPCMFIILHSIETLQRNTVVKTGTVSWFYPNNLQCYFEVVNNLVSNEEHFYSIWSSVAFNQEGVGILVFPQHHLAPRGWFNIRWVFISFQFFFSFFLDLLN